MLHSSLQASVRLGVYILVATFVVGCVRTAIYRGAGTESLPPTAVATLENNYPASLGGVNIIEVDGKHRGFGFFREYQLTPGTHTLMYEFTRYGWVLDKGNRVDLKFEVEPGRHYEIKYSLRETTFNKGVFDTWIEDMPTGRRVSVRTASSEQSARSQGKEK